MKFGSRHPCSCGLAFDDHETVFESREERVADGRAVDPKFMQENNMIGGTGGLISYTGLVEGALMDEMRDPNAIMGNVKNSIGGYAALNAIEGYGEESKGGHGSGAVSKTAGKGASTKTAFDVFHTPHSFGTKSIKAPLGSKKAGPSYKYK